MSYRYVPIVLITLTAFMVSCAPLDIVRIYKIETLPAPSVDGNKVHMQGKVTDAGESPVTEFGFFLDTKPIELNSNPNKVIIGNGPILYQGEVFGADYIIPSLEQYFFAAYLQDQEQLHVGSVETFRIDINIYVTTSPVSGISPTSATSGGSIEYAGEDSITARGVCWSTSTSPTLDDHHTSNGAGAGSFISQLNELLPTTKYYLRAYATIATSVTYGNEESFTTLDNPNVQLPVVSTTAVSNIASFSAQSGGYVSSDGGSSIIARGVCWSTMANPTIVNNHTIDGTGSGSFTSQISGLSLNTTYYVRAYATNSKGTAYGNQLSFMTTNACAGTSTLIYGGQTYNTVAIGTQCWFKENLNIGTMISGGSNQTNNSFIEKYCYNNDANNCAIYGGLYQWNEMMNYTTTPGTQGICPTGWHIPTDAEWCTLTTFLDATVNCNTWGGSGIDAGGKMKATGTTHWLSPNTGGTNSSGFTALGAGTRNANGSFGNLRNDAYFWSSSEFSSTYGIYRYLLYDNAYVYRLNYLKTGGFSVRCLRNN